MAAFGLEGVDRHCELEHEEHSGSRRQQDVAGQEEILFSSVQDRERMAWPFGIDIYMRASILNQYSQFVGHRHMHVRQSSAASDFR